MLLTRLGKASLRSNSFYPHLPHKPVNPFWRGLATHIFIQMVGDLPVAVKDVLLPSS